MKKHEFAPGIEQTSGLELTRALDIVESYYIQHISITTRLIIELFEKHKEWITNIYIRRLTGNKGMLSIHIDYNPFMYQYHLGILTPKRDKSLEIDTIKTKWEETQLIILDSMRPKRVWDNTRKASYTVSINWYRQGQTKQKLKRLNRLSIP